MSNLRIVVLDKGFIFVGRFVRNPVETDWFEIHDAQNIHDFGTTKGLGALALEGPVSETRLDAYGVVDNLPLQSLVFTIPINEDAWVKVFPKQNIA